MSFIDQSQLLNVKDKKIHNYAIFQHDSSEDDSNVNYLPINKTSPTQVYEEENIYQNSKNCDILYHSMGNKKVIEEQPKSLKNNGSGFKVMNKSFADLINESIKQLDKINNILVDHKNKKSTAADGVISDVENLNKEKHPLSKYHFKNGNIAVILYFK